MAFLSKGRAVGVIEEASYGAGGVFTNSDYLDYTACDISPDIAVIERNVIRQSMIALESLQGQETSSGTISIEISGDDDTYGLNGDLLYKNAFGYRVARTTATTVASASSSSSLTLTSASGLEVAQALKVTLGTGDEFVTITSISGNDIEIDPALSSAPTGTEPVVGLLTYLVNKPSDNVASLAIRENLSDSTGGDTVDYTYKGSVITDATLNFPVADVATADFSVGGAGFVSDNPGTTVTVPCDLVTPVVGKNAELTVLGVDYEAQDVSLNLTSEVTDIQSLTSDGIANKLAVTRAVSMNFRTEYVGDSNVNTLKAGTKGSMHLQLRDGGSTSPVIVGVYAPSVKFRTVTRSEDGNILYDNIVADLISNGCADNENAVTLYFDQA